MNVRRFVVLALLAAACRTSRPAGEQPLAPVTPSTTSEAQLTQRLRDFVGERSLVRLRMMGDQSITLKAQIQVGAKGDMLMTVYTPLNTTAARLYAGTDGQVVFLNDIMHSAWKGSAAELGGSLGFVGANPSAFAFLMLGLPAPGASVAYGPEGMQSARYQDVVVAYDPPVFPPKRVVVVRGTQRVEIDHLESFVSPAPIPPLTVPEDYTCCVLPQM